MERSEIDALVKELQKANLAYREGKPIMKDGDFDKLEQKLKEADPGNSWFKKGVNDAKPKTRKARLPHPMMSLNKVKTVEELLEWAKGTGADLFTITPKLDGLSLGITPQEIDGTAITRGDGEIGQECSDHYRMMGNKPLSCKLPKKSWVRGEVIFTNKDFDKFKEVHPDAKNSRNSATGLINGDFDLSKGADYKNLSVVCYQVVPWDEPLNKIHQLTLLNEASPEASRIPFVVCGVKDLEKEDCKMTLLKLFNDWRKEYPMDGLVFDVNDANLRISLGKYANGNPKCSIAYKDPDFTERAIVKVSHLELQLNREGVVTPVIEFTMPVNLSGADIQRVNGINMQYIHDWGIFDGQFLTIVRSGEVIPKITQVNGVSIPFREGFKSDKAYREAYQKALEERHEQMEYKVFKDLIGVAVWECPHCYSDLRWDENHVQMICPNEECTERALQSIVAFCKICGVKDFAEESIRQLFNAGQIRKIEHLFALTPEKLMMVPGWGQASIDNLLKELERIKTTLPYAQLAHASGYFGGLGQKTIQMILDSDVLEAKDGYFRVLGNKKEWEELCTIPGVQEKTAKQFLEGAEKYAQSPLTDFVKPIYMKTPKSEDGPLSGEIVCFTGFRSKELKDLIESKGGQVVDSLTKKTTVLVTKEKGEQSSKTEKAKQWGIRTVSKEEYEASL